MQVVFTKFRQKFSMKKVNEENWCRWERKLRSFPQFRSFLQNWLGVEEAGSWGISLKWNKKWNDRSTHILEGRFKCCIPSVNDYDLLKYQHKCAVCSMSRANSLAESLVVMIIFTQTLLVIFCCIGNCPFHSNMSSWSNLKNGNINRCKTSQHLKSQL